MPRGAWTWRGGERVPGSFAAPIDVRSAAALALAKCGDETAANSLRRLAVAAKSVGLRQAAVVALGVLRSDDPTDRGFLLGLVRDRSADEAVRPPAAVALGL